MSWIETNGRKLTQNGRAFASRLGPAVHDALQGWGRCPAGQAADIQEGSQLVAPAPADFSRRHGSEPMCIPPDWLHPIQPPQRPAPRTGVQADSAPVGYTRLRS